VLNQTDDVFSNKRSDLFMSLPCCLKLVAFNRASQNIFDLVVRQFLSVHHSPESGEFLAYLRFHPYLFLKESRISGRHQIDYAHSLGMGNKDYRLVDIDKR